MAQTIQFLAAVNETLKRALNYKNPNGGSKVPNRRPPMNRRLRFEIFKRDNFTCQYCGATCASGTKLHVDHIVPVAKGGTNEPGNLTTACIDCNVGKGAIGLSENRIESNGG